MSRLVGKPTMWFPNRSDTNRPVQAQKRARSLKFWSKVEEELYYLSSENKGADQLRGYRGADLRLCFRICRLLVFPRGGSYTGSGGSDMIKKFFQRYVKPLIKHLSSVMRKHQQLAYARTKVQISSTVTVK